MNEIQIFNFQNCEVRVVNVNNEPWFVGKDICQALGYADPTTAIRSHCRGVQKLHPITDSLGRRQEARIIPESDVMRLICGSTLPEAVAFEKLVFEEILPAIRRNGGYIATAGTETPEELYARAMTSLKAALDRQKAITAEQAEQLELQAPDVEYTRNVLASDGLHTVNAVAVHLGISAIRLNKFLAAENWIYRQGGVYYPATRIREKGYCDFHVVPYLNSNGDRMTREHLKWTESGRRAIIELWNKRHPAA